MQQLRFLRRDLAAQVGSRPWRWLTIWLWYGSAPAITGYRLNRCGYLLVGDVWRVLRIVLWPIAVMARLLGPDLGINYRADIGPGLRVLHPSLGLMISGKAVCGSGLILTGGNCIGSGRKGTVDGDIRIGDRVVVGANAVILGPVTVGDECRMGAGAVVVKDCEPGSTVVGVPAR